MRSEKLKDLTIVMVNDFDYVQGGASKVALETAKVLYQKGYNVLFFSGTHRDSEYIKAGFKIITLNIDECLKDKNKIRGVLRGLYNFKARKEFKKLLKTLDPNKTIIHVHGWTKTLSSSIFSIAFKMNFNVVLTLHDYFTACPNGGFFNYKKNEICKLRSLSCKCICTNCDSRNYAFKMYRVVRQFIQNKMVKLNKKIDNIIYISDLQWSVLQNFFEKKVNSTKILNPVDSTLMTSKKKRKTEDFFLFVGRVSKEKGVDLFCEAITKSGLNGIVVGDGNEKEELEGKYPKIKFVGWQSKENVEKFMLQAKALVFPSLWYEGAPLTVEEALNLGLPCIVSSSSSAVEKIVNGKNGYIFSEKNIDDLIEKMFLIKDLNYQKSHISNDNERYGEDLIRYYESLIGERS